MGMGESTEQEDEEEEAFNSEGLGFKSSVEIDGGMSVTQSLKNNPSTPLSYIVDGSIEVNALFSKCD
jgi:hypothetical protein